MIIQGKAYWAKIVGAPQPGYDKTKPKEWSLDLGQLSEDTIKTLKDEGLGPKIKNKGDERGFFISFKRSSMKKGPVEGELVPSQPIPIVDRAKKEWDGKTLIGNGSTVNVSFLVNEVPYNGKVFKKPGILKVQVVELVPYEGRDDGFESYEDAETGEERWD